MTKRIQKTRADLDIKNNITTRELFLYIFIYFIYFSNCLTLYHNALAACLDPRADGR